MGEHNELTTNLYKKLSETTSLVAAYERIKSKPGSMTPGVDGTTLDGITAGSLERLSEELKREKFDFKPERRTHIPKTDGRQRPLRIPSIRDRIVQQAMREVLEAIYEPEFRNSSHGYRPGRSCHTALKQVSTWNGIH